MRWGSYYVSTIKWHYPAKENNQHFSVGMDDMLETDKAFTSSISQLFINAACKLQLRDHTYDTFFTKLTNSPATRTLKLAKAHQTWIDLEWLPW